MDGGFTAIADVSKAMAASGTVDDHRLIGGVAVMLHIERLGLDLPLRATGDADFGVPPHVLRRSGLVDAIESLGYSKVAGNRWERRIDDRRVAAVDLLIPTYRSRARDAVTIGTVVTTEVPGLAEALRRPGLAVDVELRLTSGGVLSTSVVLPDAVGMLALKTLVRSVRSEARDVEDLWRCLEIAAADGVNARTFDQDRALGEVRAALWRELGPNGVALDVLTAGLQDESAARLRTRVRALLVETIGREGPRRQS
jgi:mRNA-degrading endonuclease toxin of MazEF toxin-antitoxin module